MRQIESTEIPTSREFFLLKSHRLSYQQTRNSYFNFLPPWSYKSMLPQNFTPKAEKLVLCQYM